MKKILINIALRKNAENIHYSYLNAYKDIFKKKQIKTFVFYKGEKIVNKNYIKDLKKIGVFLYNYVGQNDLNKQIKEIKKDNDISFINTFTETLIDTTLSLRKSVGEEISFDKDIFRNKYIQRKLLLKYNPDITIKFLEKNIDNINLKEIEDFIGYPFILKPSSGIQSAGVLKINNKKDFNTYISKYKILLKNFKEKGYNMESILVEEFIDGKMYSIDYFVNKIGDITVSKPIKVELGVDIGIDDFFNYSRIISKNTEKELENYDLNLFIKETIKATNIKNTFVHHEFKLTSKGKLKTIELNGRIGGFRLEMYKNGYNINLLDFIDNSSKQKIILKNNFSVILIYSIKNGTLKDFNRNLFAKIKKLDSLYKMKLLELFIGKEVGLTKDGFSKVGIIKLKNNDINQINKDIKFLKNHYKHLLILK